MSSFQETTSSGQTTKARDMLSAYERVQHNNSRHRENRAFGLSLNVQHFQAVSLKAKTKKKLWKISRKLL